MGNKSTCSRTFIDEKYTRPQGAFDLKEVDGRKLRRLILNRKLAPCFPGAEECTSELDECPICLLSYPSLNRSTCCSKPICTECYLRIKSEYLSWSTQPRCPFCKTSSYTVEYYGAKTVEERGIEQAEEQKVIETMIRIHQNELHDEKKGRQVLIEDTSAEAFQGETNHTLMEPGFEVECARPAQAAHMQGSLCEMNDDGDLELEDMMLMEALWLSMQEQGQTLEDFCLAQQTPTSGTFHEEGIFSSSMSSMEMAGKRCAVTGGLSRALAAHEKRPATMAEASVWNQSSQPKEACTSFSCGGAPSMAKSWWESPDFYSARSDDSAGEASLAVVSAAAALPVSFEDQIRLAITLSLAEAECRARTE